MVERLFYVSPVGRMMPRRKCGRLIQTCFDEVSEGLCAIGHFTEFFNDIWGEPPDAERLPNIHQIELGILRSAFYRYLGFLSFECGLC